jgi:hypothetical protein
MPNSWDIPPRPSHGETNENFLFAAIGRALTEWEHVEAACAELFAIFVSVSRKAVYQAPAIRAYGTVISFPGRCEMLRSAASAFFRGRPKKASRFSKQFDSLINECLGFSARRNEIAHGRVSIVYQTRRRKTKQLGYFLLPSFYNPRKYKIDQLMMYEYTSKEVLYFAQEFTKLYLKLDLFLTAPLLLGP